MDDVRRHGGNGNGCDLAGSKNNAMIEKWMPKILIAVLIVAVFGLIVCVLEAMVRDYPKAPAINYEAVIQSKQDSLERVVQQLQDCRKDLLRQDTIIMDQRSYIEQFEGLKKARPPNE